MYAPVSGHWAAAWVAARAPQASPPSLRAASLRAAFCARAPLPARNASGPETHLAHRLRSGIQWGGGCRDTNDAMRRRMMLLLARDPQDTDNSGLIDAKQMQRMMMKLGENMSIEQVDEILQHLDEDGDGQIR